MPEKYYRKGPGVQPGVAFLQALLNRRVKPATRLKIDSIFGSNTESMVRAFQKKNGLPVDGIVGPRTKSALKRPILGVVPSPEAQKFALQIGKKADFVRHIQSIEVGGKNVREVIADKRVRDFGFTNTASRYLVVKKGRTGVIDFRHFFAGMASVVSSESAREKGLSAFSGSRGGVMFLGLGNEIAQCLGSSPSCFSAEDLPSNRLGIEFGHRVLVGESMASKVKLSSQLDKYLESLQPLPPSSLSKLKLPSNRQTLVESLVVLLAGFYDILFPEAF